MISRSGIVTLVFKGEECGATARAAAGRLTCTRKCGSLPLSTQLQPSAPTDSCYPRANGGSFISGFGDLDVLGLFCSFVWGAESVALTAKCQLAHASSFRRGWLIFNLCGFGLFGP